MGGGANLDDGTQWSRLYRYLLIPPWAQRPFAAIDLLTFWPAAPLSLLQTCHLELQMLSPNC